MSDGLTEYSVRTVPELTNSTIAHAEAANETVHGVIGGAVDRRSDALNENPNRYQLYASEQERISNQLCLHYVLQLEERERKEERAQALARTCQLLQGIIQR